MRQQALTPIAKEECHQQRRAARKRKYNYNNKVDYIHLNIENHKF